MNNTIINTKDVKSLLFPTTKTNRIRMRMYKIYQKISDITTRGGTWKYNLTTGEGEFIGRKLSNEEAQEVENLKAELKKCEVELKIADLEQDFIEK